MRVVFTPRAARHLVDLGRYIEAKAGAGVADRYVERIVSLCRSLVDAQQRGRLCEDLFPGLRTLSLDRRVLIAYVVLADAIVVEGVFYGGQNVKAKLKWRRVRD